MKQFALFGAALFGTIGGFVPLIFGTAESMIGWSILGSMVGGFIGIWAAVKLYRLIN